MVLPKSYGVAQGWPLAPGQSVPAAAVIAPTIDNTPSNSTLAGSQVSGFVSAANALAARINALFPPMVTLSGAVSHSEGNSGTTPFVYTVTRQGRVGAINVPWTFAAGSTNAADFVGGTLPAGGNIAIADGQTTGTLTINVAGDTTVEPDEMFTVTIAAPSGYAAGTNMSATGTVLNDDAATTTRLADFTTGTFSGITLTCSRSTQGYAETTTGALVLFAANTSRMTNKGLLCEPYAKNILHGSSAFSSSPPWSLDGTPSFSGTMTGPDGLAGSAPVANFSASFDQIYALLRAGNADTDAGATYGPGSTSPDLSANFAALAPGTTWSLSIMAKAAASGGALAARLASNNAEGWGVGMGVKTTLSTTVWKRVSVSGVLYSASGPSYQAAAGGPNGGAANVDVGVVSYVDGTNDTDCYGLVGLWGFQLEAGGRVTSPIPSSLAAPGVRAADVYQIVVPAGVTQFIFGLSDATTMTATVMPGSTYTIPAPSSGAYYTTLDHP